jgi:CRISPR/Cas system-associated protein Cas5 (RAMP superfamily)
MQTICRKKKLQVNSVDYHTDNFWKNYDTYLRNSSLSLSIVLHKRRMLLPAVKVSMVGKLIVSTRKAEVCSNQKQAASCVFSLSILTNFEIGATDAGSGHIVYF